MLQDRLRSLSNVDIKTNAKTTEVVRGEDHVTGIRYEDMSTGEEHLLNLDGIFVQIGLLPNTSWLKDAVELNERGEIVIDRNNNTNVPGILLLAMSQIRRTNKLSFQWALVQMQHKMPLTILSETKVFTVSLTVSYIC